MSTCVLVYNDRILLVKHEQRVEAIIQLERLALLEIKPLSVEPLWEFAIRMCYYIISIDHLVLMADSNAPIGQQLISFVFAHKLIFGDHLRRSYMIPRSIH